LRDRLLEALARLALERTHLVLGVALLASVLSGVVAATQLGIDSNQDHLVSESLDYQRRFLDFLETFGDREQLYLVVELEPDPVAARAVVAQVASELCAQPEHFARVTTGLDPAELEGRVLLLAPEADVAELAAHADELRELGQLDGFERLFASFRRQFSAEGSGSGDPDEDAEQAEVGFTFLRELLRELGQPGPHDVDALLDPLLPEVEVRAEDAELRVGDLLLVAAQPTRDYGELNPVEGPLRALRAALASALEAHPGVRAGVTGRPAISADEVHRTSRDTGFSALLALLGVAIAFGVFFRDVRRPLLAIAALLVGIALTAGFATVAVGTLNFLSSVFLIILIGLGIDYGVHLLARYQARRAAGDEPRVAVRGAVLEAGRGNLTAALSSALAFFSMLLTDFRGLSELGLIAGAGILLCCLATLLVLPALLVRFDAPTSRAHPLPGFPWLERMHTRPVRVLLVVLALAAVGAPALSRFHFEENLLELQASDEDSVRWERRLLESDGSTWITASRVQTLEQAYARQAAFAAIASSVVVRTEGPGDFLGPVIERRRARLERVAERLGGPPPEPAPADPDALEAELEALTEALSAAGEGALRRGGEAATFSEPLLDLADQADELAAGGLERDGLAGFQRAFFAELGRRVARLQALTRPAPWTLETLPAAIREHFVGKDGSLAVYVYPAQDVWQPEHMQRFLAATRAVDPQLTGSTVSVHEASRVLREAFQTSTVATLIAVLLTLLLDFRGRAALLAVVPLFLGALWLAESMGALGLSLNMANFFAVPILLGLGIDDGVHMVHRAQEAPGGTLAGHAAGTGVILSSLTTAIGFGSLMTSSHAGLASLGAVMALGAGVLLAAAVVVVPALVRLREPLAPDAGSDSDSGS